MIVTVFFVVLACQLTGFVKLLLAAEGLVTDVHCNYGQLVFKMITRGVSSPVDQDGTLQMLPSEATTVQKGD